MIDSVGSAGLAPESFRDLSASLREVSAPDTLQILVSALEAADVSAPVIEHDGRTLRNRGKSREQWLTPYGLAEVNRRYYASDDGSLRSMRSAA